jgi:hypothetical protein
VPYDPEATVPHKSIENRQFLGLTSEVENIILFKFT